MKTIYTTKGNAVLVDVEDYELLSAFSWKDDGHYALTAIRKNGRWQTDSMHRILINPESHLEIDHINHNGLDNRKSNLRTCTSAQNSWNRKLGKTNTSGYKGVCWDKQNRKWRVRVAVDGKRKQVGSFNCKHEAAKAYNKAAEKHHGEFAYLNKIMEVTK